MGGKFKKIFCFVCGVHEKQNKVVHYVTIKALLHFMHKLCLHNIEFIKLIRLDYKQNKKNYSSKNM